MTERKKGSFLKETPKSQVPPTLPSPPLLPPIDLGLNAMKDLKKKRSVQNLEEGEVASQKGTKQQKTTKDPKDKRSSSVDSRKEQTLAKVRPQYCTWSPRLKVVGATIPRNAFIRDYQRGHSTHVAEALEQPLLLPKDMDATRKLKQQELFMSLKRDLAMVSSQSYTFYLFKY